MTMEDARFWPRRAPGLEDPRKCFPDSSRAHRLPDRECYCERQNGRYGAADLAVVHTSFVDQMLTVEQAFQAMRCFVDQFMHREPEQYRERFEQIIRWTRIEADGVTNDPAQWEDWKVSV